MSNHSNWDPYAVRGPRDPATFNTLQTDLVANSATLDVSNFAEEGLDSNSLENGIAAQHLWFISETTRNTGAPLASAVYVQLVLSGTTFRETLSPLVLGADDVLRIRARLQFESLPAGTLGMPLNENFNLRVNYQPNGGGSTAIAESVRGHDNNTWINIRAHPHVSVFTWLEGPLTIDWVELQYQTASGGPLYVGRTTFEGTLFREVS